MRMKQTGGPSDWLPIQEYIPATTMIPHETLLIGDKSAGSCKVPESPGPESLQHAWKGALKLDAYAPQTVPHGTDEGRAKDRLWSLRQGVEALITSTRPVARRDFQESDNSVAETEDQP
jgi:hypothetical protein